MKILVVKDDEQFINQLKVSLTEHRYVVDSALDGQHPCNISTFMYRFKVCLLCNIE